MKFVVKNRHTDKILFAEEAEKPRDAIEKNKHNLEEADLQKLDLWGADLKDANLRAADLRGTYLRAADLRNANLREADLRGADFQKADLRKADLTDVILGWTNFRGADLTEIKTNKQDELIQCLRIQDSGK